MLEHILTNIGLTQKEARIYLALLEIGTNPISKIATKAKINRVTTYDIVEKLMKRGLITHFTKAKVKYFTATDPQTMVSDFTEKAHELEKALPDLKDLHQETVRSKINYFEGPEGVKTILADTLKSKSEILHYGKEHLPELIDQKIPMRMIMPANSTGINTNNQNPLLEIRLCTNELYNFKNEIYIYDQKVAIISTGEEIIGIVMENQEIADTQRALFAMIWDFCNPQKSSPTMPLLAEPEAIMRKSNSLKNRPQNKETAEAIREDQIQLF